MSWVAEPGVPSCCRIHPRMRKLFVYFIVLTLSSCKFPSIGNSSGLPEQSTKVSSHNSQQQAAAVSSAQSEETSSSNSETPDQTQDTPSSQETGDGRFTVEYIPSPKYQSWENYLRENQVFEKVAEDLNKSLKLPLDVPIVFDECGEENAYYDAEGHRIVMCYELLQSITLSFASTDFEEPILSQKVTNTALYVFYHELGHALIDVLDLPATGREEDAADQVSTYILIDVGESGEQAVLDGADWFALQGLPGKKKQILSAMADEHSLNPQRLNNLICWVYGADPQNALFADYFSTLPQERLERCPDEYAKMKKSWDRLLSSHLR